MRGLPRRCWNGGARGITPLEGGPILPDGRIKAPISHPADVNLPHLLAITAGCPSRCQQRATLLGRPAVSHYQCTDILHGETGIRCGLEFTGEQLAARSS